MMDFGRFPLGKDGYVRQVAAPQKKNPRGGCRRAQFLPSHFAIYTIYVRLSRDFLIDFFRNSGGRADRGEAPR